MSGFLIFSGVVQGKFWVFSS